MNMNKFIAALMTLAGVIGLCFTVDSFYLRQADASTMEERIQKDQKQSIQDVIRQQKIDRLSTLRMQLSFLTNKQKLTGDEKNEVEFLRAQVIKLQTEL